MKDLSVSILSAKLGKTHMFFLGQAGFIFKSKKCTILGVDLYLSNCVERYDGFKRLMPMLINPNDIKFDYIITTHPHYDHFDIDSIPIIMSNGYTKLFASVNCEKEVNGLGMSNQNITYISYGNTYNADDILIECVFCDHGVSTPDAVGLVITIDGKKIYIAGDTCLRLDKAPEIKKHGPFDIMIAPINGAFGNLNEKEAVTLCEVLNPGLFIPCHYWNFAEQRGDPGLFIQEITKRIPTQSYKLMAIGEEMIL